jgi:hypothetical protein
LISDSIAASFLVSISTLFSTAPASAVMSCCAEPGGEEKEEEKRRGGGRERGGVSRKRKMEESSSTPARGEFVGELDDARSRDGCAAAD